MATLLLDTFTDSDGTLLTAHTMNVGSGWSAVTGTFKIVSNKATPNTDNDNDQVTADAGEADFTLQCDVVPQGSFGVFSRGPCIMVRWSDSTHLWLLDINSSGISANTLSLEENTGSGYTARAGANPTMTSGTTYTITMVLSGPNITVYLNGVFQFTYASATSNQTATKVGFRLGKAFSGTACTWDNLQVAENAQVFPPPALPRLPNFPMLWLRQLPMPIVFTPGVQQPAVITPQVLPVPIRPMLPNFGGLWLKNLPIVTLPQQRPISLDSVNVQKYPPPVHLFFPLVPLLGLGTAAQTGQPLPPPPNPPAAPPPQVLPPPVVPFLKNFGGLWLRNLREPIMPADPAVIPPPPGPQRSPAKPFFQRVPDNTDTRRLGRLTDMLSSCLNSLVGRDQLQQTGPTDWQVIGAGITAARAPGVNDDKSAGIPVGSVWVDTTSGQAYINISNGVASAVWQAVGAGGGGGLTPTGVAAGNYTSPSVSVNAFGQLLAALSPPTSATAAQGTPGSITLNCAAPVGATAFRWQRSADGITGFADISGQPQATTAATDTGLTSATTYYYRVRAEGLGLVSGYTDVAKATTKTGPFRLLADGVSFRLLTTSGDYRLLAS